MPKYLSGRVKRRDQAYLSTDRYQFLGLEQAEPNLGDSPGLNGSPNIPAGQQYQIVSLIERPGERFWVPIGGGVIPGSISVFEEGSIVGTLNSITQLNFTGNAITASPSDLRETTLTLKNSETFSFTKSLVVSQVSSSASGIVKFTTTNSGIVTLTNVSGTFDGTGVLKQDNVAIGQTPTDAGTVEEIIGVGVTIRVAPAGNENEVLFVGSDDFSTDTRFSFVDGLLNTGDRIAVGVGGTVITTTDTGKVGIGSTTPIAKLDMNVGSAFTAVNVTGTEGQLLLITDDITSGSIFAVNDVSGMPSIDVDATGTIQLAPFGENEFVGIGTTNPTSKLHVVGDTNLAGNLNVTGVSTFQDDIFVGVGATVGFGTTAYFRDNARAVFGNDEDLSIYHAGNHSYIDEFGTGNLRIRSNNFVLVNADRFAVNNGVNNQNIINSTVDGGVILYQGANEKVKTTNEGILVSGGTTTGDFKATGVSTFIGVSTFSSGVGIADSIFHNGDTNTAIRFPDVDTFTVGTAGSERFRITSTGDVGIGSDSTGGARLRVYKDGNNTLLQQWRGSLGSTGERTFNLFSPSTDSLTDYYRFQTGNAIKFNIDSIDALCINSDGKVGIGTDSVNAELHVRGNGNVTSFVEAVAGDAILDISNTGNENYSGINFTRERSTGSVVGGSIWMPSDTSSNQALLYIQTQSANANAGADGALSDNNGVRLKLASQPNGITPDSAFTIEMGSSEAFRIDNSGNVGIGSTTPISKLDVFGQTELDNLNVSGVSTFVDNIFVGVGATVGLGTTAYFRDNAKAVFGDGEDLKIYHSGEHSYIQETGTGNLFIDSSYLTMRNGSGNEIVASFTHGTGVAGGVQLYFGNSKKFQTQKEGILVSGGTTTGDFKAIGVSTFTGNIVPATTNSVNIGESVNLQFNKIFANEFIGQINTVQENQEVGNLKVNGISTFIGVSTFADGIHVVSGISTFDGNIDANAGLEVDGYGVFHSDLVLQADNKFFRIQNDAGFNQFLIDSDNGDTAIGGALDVTGNLDVDGHTELDNINVSGVATFAGNVSIAGTLTYEDVTNVDSIGIITARKDIHVGAGVSAVGVGSFGSLVVGGGTTLQSSTSVGTGKALKIISPSGFIEVGSQNTSYSHFYTDRQKFYFNKQIIVDTGVIASFNEDLILKTDQSEERIRIKNDTGNVGIGTIAPDHQLHVVQKSTDSYGTGVARFEYYDTDDAGGDLHYDAKFIPTGTYIKSFVTGAGTDFLIVDADNTAGRASFAVEGNAGNNKSFTVDSTGLVGIGTISPASMLHIHSGTPRITMSDSGTGAHHRINADSSVGNFAFDVDYDSITSTPAFIVNIKGDEKLRVTSGGGVGIGTINPTATNALTNNNSTLAVGIVTTNSLFSRDLKVSGVSTFVGNMDVDGDIIGDNETAITGISRISGSGPAAMAVQNVEYVGRTNDPYNFSFLNFNDQNVPPFGGGGNFTTLASASGLNLIYDTNDNDNNGFVVGVGSTNVSDANAFTAHMVIDHNGKVGFGTNNPIGINALTNNTATLAVGIVTTNSLFSRDLKVSGVSTFVGVSTFNDNIFVEATTDTNQLNVSGISTFGDDVSIAEKIVHTGDTNTNISFPDDDTILFKTNNYDRLRIHKNQYLVSVGSTGDIANPTNSRFRIGGRRINQAGAFATLEFMNGLFSSGGGDGTARATASIRASRDTDNYGVALTFHTAAGNPTGLSDGDFERLRIGRDGRVVIETGPLFVPNQIKHKDDEHTLIEFEEDTINFDTGGTQRLRINSSGNAVFSGNIDANGDLDVDGRTELDITNISETLNVTGISTFQDDVFVGTGATVGFGTTAYFRDHARAVFGDDENFEIFHNTQAASGAYNEIKSNSGNIRIRNHDTSASGKYFYLQSEIVSLRSHANNHAFVECFAGAQVDLYHNNSLKLSTTKEGVLVSGGTTTGDFKATGVSTFTGLVNIDGGGQANTFKVEDLTDNRIVIAGTGGELEDSANLTFNGSTLAVTGDIDANGDLDVDGTANLDDVNITGIATLSSGAFPNNVFVGERTYQTNVDIRVSSLRSGIVVRNMNNFRTDNTSNSAFMVLDPFTNSAKTFAFRAAEGIGANDITTDSGYSANTATLSDTFWVKTNGDAYFSGKVGIGSTTPQDILTLRTDDDVTSLRIVDPTANGYGGHFSFYNTDNEVRIGGINNGTKRATIRIDRDANENCLVIDGSNDTTFRGSLFRSSSSQDIGTPSNPWNKVYASEFIGLINTTQENITTGNLLVTGIATFQGNVSIAGTLTYEDVTNIDSLGIITARSDVHVGAGLSVVGVSTFKSDIKVTAGNTLTLNSNASDPVIKIQGGGPNFITFASDASGNVDSDSINLVYRTTPNTLGFERASDNTIFLTVDADDGLVTVANNLNVVSDLDVDGTANLDDVDIDGDLDVDGHTDLDNVNIAGVTTISSQLNLDTTGEGIKFGPGTAANDDAHIEWLGTSNAGYLRISTGDDSDASGTNEYIEFGDYAQTNKGGAFTQHLRIARDQFLVRTGSNSITPADRFIIDSAGKIGIKTTTPTAQLSIGNTTGDYMNVPGIQVNRPHSLGLQNGIHVYTDNSYNQTPDFQTAAFKATAVSGIAFAASTDAGSDGLGGELNARIKFDGSAYFAGNTGIGTNNPDEKLHVYNGAGNVTSFVEAIAGDALLDISNTGNGNYSGINFIRERSDGSRNGGSIFMPSNTANNEAFLYIQAQSTSAQAGQTGALSDNNGVRLKLHGDDGIFSIETGSEERLRIDNNGDVGIGTDNPGAKLDVFGNTDGNIQAIMTRGADSRFQLQFRNETSSNDAHTTAGKFGLFFQTNSIVGMEFLRGSGTGAGSLAFTNKDGETLRIDNDGDVGIGTNNPEQKLHISGTGQNTLRIDTSTSAISIHDHSEFIGFIGNDSGKLFINAGGTQDTLSLRTNGTERIRIDNNGKVGIGTDNPQEELHILNSNPSIRLQHDTGTNVFSQILQNGANLKVRLRNDSSNGGMHIQGNDGTDITTFIRVSNTGDVGIGTAIPTDAVTNNITAKLAVGIVTANEYFGTFKGAIDPGVAIENANNVNITNDEDIGNVAHYIHFGDATSGYDGVKVDSTGLVYKDSQFGLGTNSPGASLHISTTVPQIRLTDTDNSNIDHFISGSGSALHFQADQNQEDGATATTIRFSIDADEKMRINASDNVGIGTNDPKTKLNVYTHPHTDTGGILVQNANYSSNVDKAYLIAGTQTWTGAATDWSTYGFQHKLKSDSLGTPRLTIDGSAGGSNIKEIITFMTSGRVGVGSDNPAAKLDVVARGDTEAGIRLLDSNDAQSAPYIEVIGKRSDGNTSQGFGGKIHLAKNRTGAKINNNSVLGTVAFGGNHTDATEANILYTASISAVAGGSFDAADDMPTDLIFLTGSTGKTPTAVNTTTGTERLRILSGGEVFVGCTTSVITTPKFAVNVGPNNLHGVTIHSDGAENDGDLSGLAFSHGNNSTALPRPKAAIALRATGAFGKGHLCFYVDGTNDNNPVSSADEKLRITSAGLVGIGTDPQYNLHVVGTAAATNFDSLSDRRYKTNIKVIENPIEKIKKIDGVSFNWKETNEPSLGVIADDVLEVLPEIVSGKDTKSVNYNGLIGVLIEVVKDQQKQIDELRGLLDK